MGLAGTMAALASVLVALQQRGMRSAGKVLLPDFLMAGFADVGFGVLAAGDREARRMSGELGCWRVPGLGPKKSGTRPEG